MLELSEQRRGAKWPATIVRRPVGVVGAVIPWNGPLHVTLVKLVPALLAGCTIVVKAAPETPLDAYELADACEAAGLPHGVVNIVVGDRGAGQILVEDSDVDKISFTGSTAAGRWIMERCAQRIARVTLELGGKSPAVLLDDVDLDDALPTLIERMTMLSGQICVTLTRILVPRARQAEIVEALRVRLSALRVGDPFDTSTDMGPLVSSRQRERVEGYIDIGRREGARVVLGGGRPRGLDRGWYVSPTLFDDVDNRMRIAQEEIFGPVWCVIPYEDDDDAVRIANDTIYGLGAAVFGADRERAWAVAQRIRAGTVGVNTWVMDPLLPFGGFKQSGLGREHGREGLDPYLEPQVIIDAHAGA